MVGDHGVFSYEISRIPAYKGAIKALFETMELILTDEADHNIDWNHASSKTRGKNVKKSVMEEYERKRKERILAEQKKKKEEWDKVTQKKKVSNDQTRSKAAALNPNFHEAMEDDENDYNELIENDEYVDPDPRFDAETHMDQLRGNNVSSDQANAAKYAEEDEDDENFGANDDDDDAYY